MLSHHGLIFHISNNYKNLKIINFLFRQLMASQTLRFSWDREKKRGR